MEAGLGVDKGEVSWRLCGDSRTTQLGKTPSVRFVGALVGAVAAVGTNVEAQAASAEMTEGHALIYRAGVRSVGTTSSQVELDADVLILQPRIGDTEGQPFLSLCWRAAGQLRPLPFR